MTKPVLITPSVAATGSVVLGVADEQTFLSADEALDTAARLLTAANEAQGFPRTGVFA